MARGKIKNQKKLKEFNEQNSGGESSSVDNSNKFFSNTNIASGSIANEIETDPNITNNNNHQNVNYKNLHRFLDERFGFWFAISNRFKQI